MYTILMNYYLIGLGNPTEKYAHTRHNVAWILLENIYHTWSYDKYVKGRVSIEEHLTVILPDTYMNKSGLSVDGITKKDPHFNPHHLIVLHDDIDLPLGTIRVSYNRGTGGHNGIRSITTHLGTSEFIRIRVGIAQVRDGVQRKPPVLGVFEKEEYDIVISLVPQVQAIIQSLCTFGLEKTMNEYNKKP